MAAVDLLGEKQRKPATKMQPAWRSCGRLQLRSSGGRRNSGSDLPRQKRTWKLRPRQLAAAVVLLLRDVKLGSGGTP